MRTGNKIVLAADSEAKSPDGKAFYDDCKISAFGKEILFASAGLRSGDFIQNQKPILHWDSHNLAAAAVRAAESLTSTNKSIPEIAAEYWRLHSQNAFTNLYRSDPNSVAAQANRFGNISSGVFVGIDRNEKTVAYDVSLDIVKEQGHAIIRAGASLSTVFVAVMGETDITNEFLSERLSPRAIEDVRAWTYAHRQLNKDERDELMVKHLVEVTIRYSQSGDVGGQIDFVRFDENRVHWISRKPNCRADQSEKQPRR